MTYCYIIQSSLEKLLFAVDGSKHRDPQLVKVNKLRACGMLSLKWNIFITFFPPKAQGSLLKREQEDYNAQR